MARRWRKLRAMCGRWRRPQLGVLGPAAHRCNVVRTPKRSRRHEWADWDWSKSFDLTVATFAQFAGPDQRPQQFADLQKATKPGGRLLLHGFTPRQIEYGMRVNEAPGVVRMARRYSWRGAVVADDSGGLALNEICVSVVNAPTKVRSLFHLFVGGQPRRQIRRASIAVR